MPGTPGHRSATLHGGMRVFAAGILVTVALLLVGSQLALPAFYESRVADRLEEKGGSTDVSVSALPALTLIGGSGKRCEISGRNLRFDLEDQPERPFERLDGFEEVSVNLRDVGVGSIRVDRFRLRRQGRDRSYVLDMTGSATPDALAREVGETAAGPLGGLIGSLAGGLLGGGSVELPLSVQAEVRSRDGRTDVVGAQGSVAGLPTGPLTAAVVGAVLDRL